MISETYFTFSLSDLLKLNLKWLAEPDKIVLNRDTVVQIHLQAQYFAGEGFGCF